MTTTLTPEPIATHDALTRTKPGPPLLPPAPVRARLPLDLPRGWTAHDSPAPGVLLHARPSHPAASGVPTELVVSASALTGDPADLTAWRDRALADLATGLAGFELEDSDDYDLDSGPVAYRRFTHRVHGAMAVSEQWAWLAPTVPGTGVVLTCTCASESYVTWCELFESCAEALDPRRVPAA